MGYVSELFDSGHVLVYFHLHGHIHATVAYQQILLVANLHKRVTDEEQQETVKPRRSSAKDY